MKEKEKILKRKDGVTLVELLVTLAILSIVIGFTINLFLYNTRVFNKGENLSQVQFDVRMASDFITTELRNVREISITDIYAKSIDLGILSSMYPSVYSVAFEIEKHGSKYLVAYTIEGNDTVSQNYFKVETRVLLNNDITYAETTNGSIIYYE